MKFAVSNIGLSPKDHRKDFESLATIGFVGLEVALSRVFSEDWNNPTVAEVEGYRRDVESAGMNIVGLHSLFWERPEYSFFGDGDVISKTTDFLIKLSSICRDLGGKTLIYGSRTARTKGERSTEEANIETVDFFSQLSHKIEHHGTCFCIEPLEKQVSDYVHSVLDSQAVVKAVNHPTLRVQIDTKAMAFANEVFPEVFKAISDDLVHVHANEPGFDILGSSGLVNHTKIGTCLKEVGYEGYLSIEQRMINKADPLASIRQSAKVLKQCYA